MKYTFLIGIIFIAIFGILYFISGPESKFDLNFLQGILGGAGAGLVLGGVIGYFSRKPKVVEKKSSEEKS